MLLAIAVAVTAPNSSRYPSRSAAVLYIEWGYINGQRKWEISVLRGWEGVTGKDTQPYKYTCL